MARFAGGDFSERRPKASFSDVSREWFQRVSHELWQQHRTLDRAHPLYPRGLREAVGFGNGYLFPEPDVPLVVKVEDWDEALPDFLSLNFISNRIKDEVERLEPNKHQLIPLIVESSSQAKDANEGYWIFNNLNRLDTVSIQDSEGIFTFWFNEEKWPDFTEYRVVSGCDPKIVLDKSRIDGCVSWSDYKLGHRFFSEQFSGFLDDHAIKGWELSDSFSRRSTIIESVGAA